ncbi:MAG: CotH kinase family protein, partial [Planctomycetota bacterium]|nr:CotH kinase family protein [Planctomycetota bacterium]
MFRRDSSLRGAIFRAALVSGCALVLIITGAWLRDAGWFGQVKTFVYDDVPKLPNLVRGWFTDIDRITIDIKHKDFQELARQRARALEIDHLFSDDLKFVKAKIRAADQEHGARIRLKGDHTDHLQGAKWSFRVELRKDTTMFGMKRFSLHHPGTRNFLGEWVYHEALRRAGVAALRYRFAAVTLNGKDLGIYALEEHFDKRVLENNELREGPIVRFNENLFWREKVEQELPFTGSQLGGAGSYSSGDVDGFKTSAILADPVQRKLFTQAVSLLERFRSGELATSEVFDIEKLARYFAVTDLLGAEHGARWHNARFYLNPITTHLEPIGFDGDAGRPTEDLCGLMEGVWVGREMLPPTDLYYARLFSDSQFFEAYVTALEQISDPAWVDALLAEIAPDLAKNQEILQSEFYTYAFSPDVLARNAGYIKSILHPAKALHAYASATEDGVLRIELGSIQALPVEVLEVLRGKEVIHKSEHSLLLPGRLDEASVQFTHLEVPSALISSEEDLAGISIRYRLFGSSVAHKEKAFAFARAAPIAINPPRQIKDLGNFEFVEFDRESLTVRILPGRHTLREDLIIPGGLRVIVGAGTRLDLVDSALVLSHSSVEMSGTREDPIVFHSTDGTGQGFVVLGARQESTLSWVQFRGLSAGSRPGWQLTGAVTFYESPVKISECWFDGAKSEDALNLVRCDKFEIEHSKFRTSFSDALDADFCTGKILGSSFVRLGNDAVDVSGSSIEIVEMTVKGAGDKGISAGENSRVTARKIQIEDADMGVASKDMSR